MKKKELWILFKSLVMIHIIIDILFFILLLGNSVTSITGIVG
jgi:hypothetical protein